MSDYDWEKVEETEEEIPMFVNARQQKLWDQGLVCNHEMDTLSYKDD